MNAFPNEGCPVSDSQRPVHGVRRALAVGALALAGMAAVPGSASADASHDLYLVTLDGPGLSGTRTGEPPVLADLRMRAQQARVLASVEAPVPVRTWRTALNGFAVELTDGQAERLTAHPDVALVEPNEVRPLAAAGPGRSASVGPGGPS